MPNKSAVKKQHRLISVPIDSVADASLQTLQTSKGSTLLKCDACGNAIEGEPSSRGLLMWTRGGEVRFDEEPALCARCSIAIGVTALAAWNVEEEEG